MISRFFVLQIVWAATLAALGLGFFVDRAVWWALLVLAPLSAIGLLDMIQTQHSILRNYPIIGHFRFWIEAIRPEIRQYLIEDDRDPVPFSREQRALVYRRAKNAPDQLPFGTIRDVNAIGYGWISHSMAPLKLSDHDFRIAIGGKACLKPYQASVLNISGTSFGSVSSNAILALNKGARKGGFAHNTGEGSISRYHVKGGGDLIWQIASGYFGCRTKDGRFDPNLFAKAACGDQVKMIEIKLSQGAKPGHGGVLPRAKITAEIARTRLIDRTRDCISPARHPEFSTPLELMAFISKLRDLSGGKPVGFKLCVGHRFEFLALIKAMLESGVTPDFIVIDGGEGGTGAAPVELSNHVGLPLIEGLSFVHNALVGAGLRSEIRLGASGKVVSAFDFCRIHALGADYVMSARGFMFALGCVQARACHTNHCPSGVATQDKGRAQALVVSDKFKRVHTYHRNTLRALAEMLGAAGLKHPSDLKPWHLHIRAATGEVVRGDVAYTHLEPGALLSSDLDPRLKREWDRAQTQSFEPAL
ncbi:conserved region in glutamate synthase family protein [Asticcacaulis biprosthecium C19]|uniref:Conserved region in glutamate synthase family protein n=1 Tax=Asticcacaulis biprosthecium C19 TaxID=715226 RepID=F4QPI3_9CAUL|nr:FMN-binding glutamate synthase family protein [Asticcacaulis biprosthecium]EGF91241.1 conserved region in glutamate synthase family protein [Asticcacaulis biprosthecium C19]